MEFGLFLQEWLDRIPEFEVKPGTRPIAKAAPTNTVESLWLSWDADPASATAMAIATGEMS
jgi:hypothetical protein